jgi:hypothetical protein
MKIWMLDAKSSTHRIVRLNCEEHSNFTFLGDLNDDEFREFLLDLQDDIDVEKNLKLIKYYGYLHLFIMPKKRA